MNIKNSKGKPFDKCFIDADSIIYRIALKTDIDLKQAMEYYDKAIEDIEWETCSTETKVALKGTGNFRYGIAEDYKGQRKLKEQEEDPNPELTERRKELNEYAYSLGHFKSDNCEADDIVSIWAQEAYDAGEHYVIAHIDKDINGVPGWHYNFNKKDFYFMDEEAAHKFFCLQLLIGDSTDNIQGLKGIGPKKAEKLLEGVAHKDLLEVVGNAWREHHPRDWKTKLEVCFNLIYMRRNWDGFRHLTLEEVFTDE